MHDLFFKRIPMPIAGLALACISLGGLLKTYSEAFLWVGIALCLLCIALIATKAIFSPHSFRDDFRSPVFASVSAAALMAIMQVCGVFAPSPVALAFWYIAIATCVFAVIWFSVTFLRGFDWGNVFPSYFILYVGVAMAAISARGFGLQVFGRVCFWLGFAGFLFAFVLVTYRVATRPSPEPVRPLICIYAAPPHMLLVGYLSCFDSPNTIAVLIAIIIAQIIYVLVLTRIPSLLRILHKTFYPSVAAMTFPLVISAMGLSRALAFLGNHGWYISPVFHVIVLIEMAFAIAIVIYALARYIGFFYRLAKRGDKEFG